MCMFRRKYRKSVKERKKKKEDRDKKKQKQIGFFAAKRASIV